MKKNPQNINIWEMKTAIMIHEIKIYLIFVCLPHCPWHLGMVQNDHTAPLHPLLAMDTIFSTYNRAYSAGR